MAQILKQLPPAANFVPRSMSVLQTQNEAAIG